MNFKKLHIASRNFVANKRAPQQPPPPPSPKAHWKTVKQRSKTKQQKKTVGGRIFLAFSSNLTTIICVGGHSARSKLDMIMLFLVYQIMQKKKKMVKKQKARLISGSGKNIFPVFRKVRPFVYTGYCKN